jgi:hypothetical protein
LKGKAWTVTQIAELNNAAFKGGSEPRGVKTGASGQSCRRIADYLNALRVPSACTLPGRRRLGPKTAARWPSGMGANLLISTVYKGQHVYGYLE